MIKPALIAATAATLFASALPLVATAGEQTVKCSGVNSCKGTSSCKTALNSCKGQNSCKGLGWTPASTEIECVSRGGKVF